MSQEESAQRRGSIASTNTDVQSEMITAASVIKNLDYGHDNGALHESTHVAGEDDWENHPANARNWPFRRKWTTVAVVSLYTFVPPLASSMMAPGLNGVARQYAITSEPYVALTLSVFLLSFALGPLVLAPLSEMYGRTWVLHIGNIFTVAFSLGCAFAPNAPTLVAFRFLSGFSGSTPIACGAGSISDCFAPRDRASAMAVYTLGPLVGPVIGPIAGGFIADAAGIKFVFVTLAGIGAVSSLIGLPLLRETYAPVIRRRLARRLNDPEKLGKASPSFDAQETKLQFMWTNLTRPLIMLVRSFICFILSIYMALRVYHLRSKCETLISDPQPIRSVVQYTYRRTVQKLRKDCAGIYYLMFCTFGSRLSTVVVMSRWVIFFYPDFFSTTYGFNAGIGGLAYLGLGIGFFTATVFGAQWADQIYTYLADKSKGVGKPEMRMPALFVGSFFIPIGLFWFGWSAQAKIHWIMPIIGSGIFGFGMMTCFLPIQLYLVDAFRFAASATAAASVIRSLMGFVFPLFGPQMYNALGYGGGNSLLAGFAIILGIPFPVWIYYKGESIRLNSKVKL